MDLQSPCTKIILQIFQTKYTIFVPTWHRILSLVFLSLISFHFSSCIISMVHHLTQDISAIFTDRATIITETARFMLELTLEQCDEFVSKVKGMASNAGCKVSVLTWSYMWLRGQYYIIAQRGQATCWFENETSRKKMWKSA